MSADVAHGEVVVRVELTPEAVSELLSENAELRAAIDDHIEKLRDGTYCDMGLEDIADAFRAATEGES